MIEKRWQFITQPIDTNATSTVKLLTEELGISTTLATLLWQRGVHNFEEAKAFFRPQLDQLNDPFLMKDMDLALERLEKAIENKETIVIYGDYDVDGTTAVALVYGFLRSYHSNILYYNPDRYKEGYGVSKKGIDWAKEQGASLIIALDCGIKSIDKIEYAKTQGIEFIICDHHEPGEELPQAVAVLDPKRKDCPYPFKELTGNGVGFKLLTAFCLKRDIPLEELFEFLDLAMVSIASDIVPIIGENRILAFYGLKKLNEKPRTSLKALKEVAGFQGEMSIESVVFTLGPRINAAGRIKHAKAAVKLLLSEDYEEAVNFAYEIQDHNTERKTHDSRITEEALAMIREDDWLFNEAKSTVLYREDWHKGVIGIVASRCIEHFYRPTVIFTKSKEGFAAGSARSVSGFNLYDAIESCSGILEQFGGHMHAAGMTIPIERIDEFRTAFDRYVSDTISPELLVPEIKVDIEISLDEIDSKFYRIMKQMGPFGPKNMQPVFVTHHLSLAASPRILKEKHMKLELVDKETGVSITALGFNMTEYYHQPLLAAETFSAVYTIEENNFRGKKTLQLFLKDLKF
ncbi:single-stranded-DNA-specific exonuclease RecJ [Jiulongibacter sp. NS-SX5]|uniref:single-stranded-DNA-specific exonuclease RecJ n=1 Tax=Jiulongibacter sp. NS-SX5 TaxID=3463854 RepID=UPI00405A4610